VISLEQSYAYCRSVARQRARNFYYAFILLSREQRDAMCAVYAFMRCCDDLSDEPGATREGIERWRGGLDRALDGEYDDHPSWPALHDAVVHYKIPSRCFYEMIDGVTADLEPRQIQTVDELYRYCYQVASVVGIAVIYILGFDDERAIPLAEKCGIAFQLTNILRDIREDADRGRTYLPAEDLARFGVSLQSLKQGDRSEHFVDLMRFEIHRARSFYKESGPLTGLIHRQSRSSLWALIEIYRRLLEKIETTDYDVFSRRISLSAMEKYGIVLKALWRSL
jgi:phytoene synthase